MIHSDNNDDNYGAMIISLFVAILIITIMSISILRVGKDKGKKEAIEQFHNEAVEAGVAEYYFDDSHDKQFRWK